MCIRDRKMTAQIESVRTETLYTESAESPSGRKMFPIEWTCCAWAPHAAAKHKPNRTRSCFKPVSPELLRRNTVLKDSRFQEVCWNKFTRFEPESRSQRNSRAIFRAAAEPPGTPGKRCKRHWHDPWRRSTQRCRARLWNRPPCGTVRLNLQSLPATCVSHDNT